MMGRCHGTFMNEISFYDSWVPEMGLFIQELARENSCWSVFNSSVCMVGFESHAARSHFQLGLDLSSPRTWHRNPIKLQTGIKKCICYNVNET